MNEESRITTRAIREAKGRRKIVCLTAYDFATARLVDEAGVDIILVGDSLAMTVLGYESTLPVGMAEMLHHTAAVVRGTRRALVVADMPFLSYQVSGDQAVENAGRFIKEAGAAAVKIEGGAIRADLVRRLVDNGIPVMGHIGMTPQSIHELGGYRVRGREPREVSRLKEDAVSLDQAGVFCLVLECVPRAVAAEITATVSVPTIGIGAGPDCDGQILVIHDLLGLYGEFKPKFVKRYAELGREVVSAVQRFRDEVLRGDFPDDEHSYH